jgi:hypothetical protein
VAVAALLIVIVVPEILVITLLAGIPAPLIVIPTTNPAVLDKLVIELLVLVVLPVGVTDVLKSALSV